MMYIMTGIGNIKRLHPFDGHTTQSFAWNKTYFTDFPDSRLKPEKLQIRI